MNRAHRLADQFRNVVGWLGRVPTESQFVSKGFLTPAEFVEAGDQLVFQCPTWQWQACFDKKHQVFWLPSDKQFLLTRNIPCRHRVIDWDRSFCKQSHETTEGWLVPGPQPDQAKDAAKPETGERDPDRAGGDQTDRLGGRSREGSNGVGRFRECRIKTADGNELAVRHEVDSSEEISSSEEEEEERSVAQDESLGRSDEFVEVERDQVPSCTATKGASRRLADLILTRGGHLLAARSSGPLRRSESASGSHSLLQAGDAQTATNVGNARLVEDDFTLIGGGKSVRQTPSPTADKKSPVIASSRKKSSQIVPTRSYDLSVTYDKYYQSPRLWLFGYDECGVPLRAEAVFEDIHTDYLSKTVTVDPHPFTGVPTVSIHPCKHAAVMRTVAQNWLKSGVLPRHDLALFVLLKMVSSVVPTINYDFTIDIEMPLGLSLPLSEEATPNQN